MGKKMKTFQRTWRWLAAALMLWYTLTPSQVWAHPEILVMEPPADAELETPPSEVLMVFSEQLEAAFSQIRVFNTSGEQVDRGDGGRDPNDPTALLVSLGPLDPGLYSVVWQTIGSDGHQIRGSYSFTVLEGAHANEQAPSTAPEAPSQPSEPTPSQSSPMLQEPAQPTWLNELLVPLLRSLMLLFALTVSGAWFSQQSVFQPAWARQKSQIPAQIEAGWRSISRWSLGLLLISCGAFLLSLSLIYSGQLSTTALTNTLSGTRLGSAVAVRGLIALLMLGLFVLPASLGRVRDALFWLSNLALLASFSFAGHAAAQAQPLLPIVGDLVHMAACAVWVGGLITLVLLLPRVKEAAPAQLQAPLFESIVTRFSSLALISVVCLTLSGLYAGSLHLQTLSQLWTSSYGLALLVKLIVFGFLIALGAYNLIWLRPRFVAWAKQTSEALGGRDWPSLLQNTLRLEVVGSIVILLAVGVLTNLAPPQAEAALNNNQASANLEATAQSTPTAPRPTRTPLPTRTLVPSVPFHETRSIDGLELTVDLQPASIGKNRLELSLRDETGGQGDVQKVVARINMVDMDMGEILLDLESDGAGKYHSDQLQFTMLGEWEIIIEVRRAVADDFQSTFHVPVGD
jgi:copper transport protein